MGSPTEQHLVGLEEPEQSKAAIFLKWLTLPILAFTIAITIVPTDYQETR